MKSVGKAAVIFFTLALITAGFLLFKFSQFRQKQATEQLKAKAEEISITIIEGWTVNDIASYLQNSGIMSANEFVSSEKKFNRAGYEFLKKLPSGADLEGFLYPDTYRIFKSTSELSKNDPQKAGNSIIEKLLTNFKAKVETLDLSKPPQHLTLYQLVTLASIVEKETGRETATLEQKQKLDEERKIIAGIFYNRLEVGMLLESDATINYVTGKNNPTPTLEDLSANSPYNTYKNGGLPPGPICNPSLSSIKAVLNPATSDYFYFLHDQKTGQAIYSKTFEEHIQNKFKYLK